MKYIKPQDPVADNVSVSCTIAVGCQLEVLWYCCEAIAGLTRGVDMHCWILYNKTENNEICMYRNRNVIMYNLQETSFDGIMWSVFHSINNCIPLSGFRGWYYRVQCPSQKLLSKYLYFIWVLWNKESWNRLTSWWSKNLNPHCFSQQTWWNLIHLYFFCSWVLAWQFTLTIKNDSKPVAEIWMYIHSWTPVSNCKYILVAMEGSWMSIRELTVSEIG